LFIVLAVVLGGVAWFSLDSARDRGDERDVQEVVASGRLLQARLAFERSALDLLLDRMLVGVGAREPDSKEAIDAADRLRLSYAEIEDLAQGDGPVGDVASALVDSLDGDLADDPLTGDRTSLYEAVDDVRWSADSVPGSDQFDALYELGFFAVLPDHVLVEGLAAYTLADDLDIDPSATPLSREVIDVLQTEGGWFGESADVPLTDSEWFDIENARSAFPEVTEEIEREFAASDIVVVDTWMRDFGDEDMPTSAPIPLDQFIELVGDLEEDTTALVEPLSETETDAAIARAESDSDTGFTLTVGGLVAGVVALLVLIIGLTLLVRYRRTLRRLSDLALNDPVTGVSSRYVLETSVRSALTDARYGHHVVVVVDLDHFKLVNDAFGHAAGDAVLREIGTRLQAIADVIAASTSPAGRCHVVRMGGDEFLIAVHAPTEVSTDRIEAELDAARQRPLEVTVDGRVEALVPEFSFGLADARGGGDLDQLMSAADLAAYADKTRRATDRPRRDPSEPVDPRPSSDEITSSS
jgi:diguanylate cyclase (GGDEF)-like protein